MNWAKGVDRQRPVLNWNGGDTEKSVVYQNLLECAGSTILVIFHVRVLTKSELASGYFESLIRADLVYNGQNNYMMSNIITRTCHTAATSSPAQCFVAISAFFWSLTKSRTGHLPGRE